MIKGVASPLFPPKVLSGYMIKFCAETLWRITDSSRQIKFFLFMLFIFCTSIVSAPSRDYGTSEASTPNNSIFFMLVFLIPSPLSLSPHSLLHLLFHKNKCLHLIL